ncbi:MAG: type IX secretion system protein PorQ [Bacteroidales bacterium]|nr:type IX secretion system protein PorQ [Bacteroidales bacterium]
MPFQFENISISTSSYTNINRWSVLLFLLIVFVPVVPAQPGGKAYQFLEITNSARIAATGGSAIAVYDDDLNVAYHNPGLLNADMHHELVLNYVNYFAGINYGYAACAANIGRKGTVAGGIHYLNYGRFDGADENGLLTGTFRAADYSVNISYARPVDSLFSAGFTVKSIYSDLEAYHSTAIAFDIGCSYHNPALNFTAGLVFRNAGWQMSSYYMFGDREALPFNIAASFSQGLQYAPVKFFLVAEHLEKWDLTYKSELTSENTSYNLTKDLTGESGFDQFVDKFMRHIVAGAEFYPNKNIILRLGYNYRRRQEMKIDSKPGMVGFSWGLGIRISKFRFDYGRSAYHLAGGVNYFSLSVNLDELKKNF